MWSGDVDSGGEVDLKDVVVNFRQNIKDFNSLTKIESEEE